MERSTVGSLLRSTQAYCLQLSEKQTLDHGIAYYSEAFRDLPQANQFREVVVKDDAGLEDAFDEAQRWFSDHGLKCRRWASASGSADPATTRFLADRGFLRLEFTAMVLTRWVDVPRPADMKILPARAMRAAVRGTFVEDRTNWKVGPTNGAAGPANDVTGSASRGVRPKGDQTSRMDRTGWKPVPHVRPAGDGADITSSVEQQQLAADACNRRMDDPQFDLFVAMVRGKPAGRCALYQVGDIARVTDFHVLPSHDEQDVGGALVAHVLALAKRLAMRNICLQVDSHAVDWRHRFEELGFVADGTLVEFHRDSDSDADRGSPS